jgi:galactitol-specific phosphotransferase system IIB component
MSSDSSSDSDVELEVVEIVEPESKSSSSRKKISDVYDYIKEDSHTSAKFYCALCKEKNKIQRWRVRNTGNFRYHLETHHKDTYVKGTDPSQSKIYHHFTKKKSTQSKRRRRSADFQEFTKSDKTNADSKLVDWVVNHSQPFSVIEQEDFVEFVGALRENYKLPTRNTIRNRIIKKWSDEKARVRKLLKNEISGFRCGVTTDMWTSAAKKGYMVITMHYINQDWLVKSVVIAFIRVLYPHTGERLAEHFIQAIKDMDPILLSSLWAITADNASSNLTMVSHLHSTLQAAIDEQTTAAEAASDSSPQNRDFTSIANSVFLVPCFAHTLQLAIKEGLKKCKTLDVAIGRFRDSAKAIADSTKLREAFATVCSSLNVKFRVPELDVETRWNSTWSMLECMISLRKPLEELLRRIRCRHEGYCDFSIGPTSKLAAEIPAESWSAVNDFCSFLTPFKEATVLMSGSSYPTLGLVVPVFYMIKEHVHKAIKAQSGFKSTHTIKFAKAVQSKLEAYDAKIKGSNVMMAAALDPRVKCYIQKIGMDVNAIKRSLLEEFQCKYSHKYNQLVANTTGTSSSQDQSISMMESFMGVLDGKQNDEVTGAPQNRQEEPFCNELDRWFSHSGIKLTQSSHDVCIWFKVNTAIFPRVALMARDFLGVTSTSVPSECVFSNSGTVVSKRRARLGDDAIQAICELQSFLQFK